MKQLTTFAILFLCVASIGLAFSGNDSDPEANNLLNNTNKNFFIENKGQWDDEILYLAKLGGENVWITKSGVVYDYYLIERESHKDGGHLPKVQT